MMTSGKKRSNNFFLSSKVLSFLFYQKKSVYFFVNWLYTFAKKIQSVKSFALNNIQRVISCLAVANMPLAIKNPFSPQKAAHSI